MEEKKELDGYELHYMSQCGLQLDNLPPLSKEPNFVHIHHYHQAPVSTPNFNWPLYLPLFFHP